MYWICLTREELELAINALYMAYEEGVSTDEEEKEEQAMRALREKLEFIKEHNK